MNITIQKTLEDVGLDALIREAQTIPSSRRFELQQRHATGGPNFDLGQFAGLALALRRVEAGASVAELRELVLAMAEQAFYCRQAQAQMSDPAFRAELDKEIADIESGRAKPNDASLALRNLEAHVAEQKLNGNGHSVPTHEQAQKQVG